LASTLSNAARLHPFGPAQPPREPDDPVGQHGLHLSRRGQLLQHLVPVKLELGGIFPFDDHLLCQEAVLDRILRRHGLTFRGARTGRFLGVGTIGKLLRCTGHDDPSKLTSIYYYYIFCCISILQVPRFSVKRNPAHGAIFFGHAWRW
jgi:hypothetical protein